MTWDIQNPRFDSVFSESSTSCKEVRFYAKNTAPKLKEDKVLKDAPPSISNKQQRLIEKRAQIIVDNEAAKDVLQRDLNNVRDMVVTEASRSMAIDRDKLSEQLQKEKDEDDQKFREEQMKDRSFFDQVMFLWKIKARLSFLKRSFQTVKDFKVFMRTNNITKISDLFKKENSRIVLDQAHRTFQKVLVDGISYLLEEYIVPNLMPFLWKFANFMKSLVHGLWNIASAVKNWFSPAKTMKSNKISKFGAKQMIKSLGTIFKYGFIIDTAIDVGQIAWELYNIEETLGNLAYNYLKVFAIAMDQERRGMYDIPIPDKGESTVLFATSSYKNITSNHIANKLKLEFKLDINNKTHKAIVKDEKNLSSDELFYRYALVSMTMLRTLHNKIGQITRQISRSLPMIVQQKILSIIGLNIEVAGKGGSERKIDEKRDISVTRIINIDSGAKHEFGAVMNSLVSIKHKNGDIQEVDIEKEIEKYATKSNDQNVEKTFKSKTRPFAMFLDFKHKILNAETKRASKLESFLYEVYKLLEEVETQMS